MQSLLGTLYSHFLGIVIVLPNVRLLMYGPYFFLILAKVEKVFLMEHSTLGQQILIVQGQDCTNKKRMQKQTDKQKY